MPAFEWGKVPDGLERAIEDLPDSVVLDDDKTALAELTRGHWLEAPRLALPGEYERVGSAIVWSIAFTGTAALFAVQPPSCIGQRPECALSGSKLLFIVVGASNVFLASKYFAEQEHLLSEWLLCLSDDVADHNAQVDRTACHLFEQRRLELLPLLLTGVGLGGGLSPTTRPGISP